MEVPVSGNSSQLPGLELQGQTPVIWSLASSVQGRSYWRDKALEKKSCLKYILLRTEQTQKALSWYIVWWTKTASHGSLPILDKQPIPLKEKYMQDSRNQNH